MSSKSSFLSLLFVGLATILVCAFTGGHLTPLLHSIGFNPELGDIFTTVALVLLGIALIGLGADLSTVMIIGTMGVFLSLTWFQTDLIRYMTFAALLFAIGMYGMVVSRNAVRVLMSIELMLNAVNINLVALSRYIDPTMARGQVFAVFILTVAAAEAAVGLAIVLSAYRNMSTVDMEKFNLLKW